MIVEAMMVQLRMTSLHCDFPAYNVMSVVASGSQLLPSDTPINQLTMIWPERVNWSGECFKSQNVWVPVIFEYPKSRDVSFTVRALD